MFVMLIKNKHELNILNRNHVNDKNNNNLTAYKCSEYSDIQGNISFVTRVKHELKGLHEICDHQAPTKQTHEFTSLIWNNGNSGIHGHSLNKFTNCVQNFLGAWNISP